MGEHRAQVRADLTRVLAALRHPGNVATAVLRGFSVSRRVGRDSGRVEIAVYPLGDPVGGEWSAKPAKHVVAREPPPADVEEHRRDRVRTVKVIQDPEEIRLPLLPINREVLIAVERAEYLVGVCVHLSSSPAGPHTNTRSVCTPGSRFHFPNTGNYRLSLIESQLRKRRSHMGGSSLPRCSDFRA